MSNEEEFSNLLKRYLSGVASKEEREAVENWLDGREKDFYGQLSDPERQDIKESNRRVLMERIRRAKTPIAPSVQVVQARARKGTRRIVSSAIVAAVLLSAVAFTWKWISPEPQAPHVAFVETLTHGEMRKIILGDGTLVWLRGTSSITYPEKFTEKERRVVLEGEGLFEVAKDASRPFFIECGGIEAKVLGTSFNIRTHQEQTEIVVLTGKVALTSQSGDQRLVVLPNEKAVYDRSKNEIAKTPVPDAEKQEKISGTQYSMNFHATPMREIIKRIEGKFDVNVVMEDERLNNCTITADFTDQSLERTISLIAQSLGVDFKIEAGEVQLKGGGGCAD